MPNYQASLEVVLLCFVVTVSVGILDAPPLVLLVSKGLLAGCLGHLGCSSVQSSILRRT